MPVGIRSLAYMSLVGFVWLVALPAALLTIENGGPRLPTLRGRPSLILGATALLAGQALATLAGGYLTIRGRGTPWPLDPPRELVTTGPYRFLRNPLALALMLMIAGEALVIRSRLLWLILPMTLIYLEGFASPWEDRQLEAMHGERYLEYKRRVPKWLPGRR